MAKRQEVKVVEIPSFACEETYEAEVCGRRMTFYAVSGPVLLKLQQRLGSQFAGVAQAFASRASGEERKAALADLFEAAGKHGPLVAELILDSLRDEDWNRERPAKGPAIEAFLAKVDGPALLRFLAAVATINTMAFLPSVPDLLAAFAAAVSGKIPEPAAEDEVMEAASAAT